MIDKIEKLARDLRADYGLAADRALTKVRAAALDTADLIAKSKAPVRKIADTGIKLNRISHKGLEKLMKSQARLVEATIDDGARRLEMAARADSLRALFGDQIATFPQSRERTLSNARKSIEVVRDTGDEIGDVLKGTVGEFQATVVASANTARSLVKKQAAEAEAAFRTAVAETEKAIGRQAGRVKLTAAELEATAKKIEVNVRKTAATTKGVGTRKVTEAEKEVKKATAQVKRAVRKAARPAGKKAAAKKASAKKATAKRKAVSKRRPAKVAKKSTTKKASAKKVAA